ncbi:MAG: hypothetical protein EXR75_15035 [Myxococcales bacterium]|nr:hypothetical protein [Myxococcales bacterium]
MRARLRRAARLPRRLARARRRRWLRVAAKARRASCACLPPRMRRRSATRTIRRSRSRCFRRGRLGPAAIR